LPEINDNPFEVAQNIDDSVEERKTSPEDMIRESEGDATDNRAMQVLHGEIVEPGRLMQEPPMPQAHGEAI
jgi:hypothetical protein